MKTLDWTYEGTPHHSTVLAIPCPHCKAFALIVLPEALRKTQPDGTTHVCHPLAGGCNHGFTDDDIAGVIVRCWTCREPYTLEQWSALAKPESGELGGFVGAHVDGEEIVRNYVDHRVCPCGAHLTAVFADRT